MRGLPVALVGLMAIALMLAGSSPAGAAPKFSPWGAPRDLGCTVNSPFSDFGPAVSRDGLTLFFGSNRPTAPDDATLDFNIWVSRRASPDAPWEAPALLGINTPVIDNIPSLSRDEHWLFFNSNRPGSRDVDIWVAWREHVHDPFGWEAPVNLGDGVNTPGFDAGAAYFENEEGDAPLLFFNRGATQATTDIYVSELMPDGEFGPAVLVEELSSPANDQRPTVRSDGLELFLGSGRGGNFDVWVSTRETVFAPWSTPVNLGPPINTAATDFQPYIAADRQTLYFASNRPDPTGCGDGDLYVTTRAKLRP